MWRLQGLRRLRRLRWLLLVVGRLRLLLDIKAPAARAAQSAFTSVSCGRAVAGWVAVGVGAVQHDPSEIGFVSPSAFSRFFSEPRE
jgi:hypothetical protein